MDHHCLWRYLRWGVSQGGGADVPFSVPEKGTEWGGCRDADGYGGGSDGLPDRQSQKDGADGGAQVAGGEAGQIIHHGPK